MLQTSYEAKTKDVWVFIETKDGKARNVGLELLNPGRRLAGIQGGKAVALVIGHNCEDAVKEAIAHGADKVLLVDNEVYGHTAPTLTPPLSYTALRRTAPPPF